MQGMKFRLDVCQILSHAFISLEISFPKYGSYLLTIEPLMGELTWCSSTDDNNHIKKSRYFMEFETTISE
jgi:hypothetical protein